MVQDAEQARVASEDIDPNDFLSTILNEDGIVEIGENIFLVDTAEQVVLVLPSVYQDQVDDLVNRNLANTNITLFSTSDDVLDLLEEGSTGTMNRSAGLFCKEDGADRGYDPGNDTSPYGSDIRQQNKIVYQKAGIYFSLQSKTKVQFRGWTGIWTGQSATDQIIRYYAAYKPKCRSVVVKQGDLLDDGNDNELNYRPYESTRGLHEYEFEVLFYGFGFWSRSYYIIYK